MNSLTLNNLQIGSRDNKDHASLLRLPPFLLARVNNCELIAFRKGKFVWVAPSVCIEGLGFDYSKEKSVKSDLVEKQVTHLVSQLEHKFSGKHPTSLS